MFADRYDSVACAEQSFLEAAMRNAEDEVRIDDSQLARPSFTFN